MIKVPKKALLLLLVMMMMIRVIMVIMIIMVVMIEKLLLLQLLTKLPPELLPVPGLVVLEPVKYIFALNLAIEGELGSDVLDLRGVGGSDASPVHLLKDHQLLWGWAPS